MATEEELLQLGSTAQALPQSNLLTLIVCAARLGIADSFLAGRGARYGTSNPEEQDIAFHNAMIAEKVSPHHVSRLVRVVVGEPEFAVRPPTFTMWHRTRPSVTPLPDGRVVHIAGKYVGPQDRDVWCYNDVLVTNPDDTFTLYGYPPWVFAPTFFHTATLVAGFIYIIGCGDYPSSQHWTPGRTPVFRLSLYDFSIQRFDTSGQAPGWIYGHSAEAISDHQIVVGWGMVAAKSDNGTMEDDEVLEGDYMLDVRTGIWTKR